MAIRERGYHNWEGELSPPPLKWLPMFRNGIRMVYKKRFAKMFFFCCLSMFFIFLMAVYLATRPELKAMTNLVRLIPSTATLFKTYYSNGTMVFFMIIMCVFAGAEQISHDIKFKSFTLYLSRPLSRFDYVAGKYSIVLFYLLALSLVPGLLLQIFRVIFSGKFDIPPQVFLAGIVFPIIVSLFMVSLVILFSSLSPNSRLVKIMYFVTYFITESLAHGLAEGLDQNAFLYLSIQKNIERFADFIFGTRSGFYTPGLIAGLILVGLGVLFFAIVNMRMKRVEV